MVRNHACTEATASASSETVRRKADTRPPTETSVLVDLGNCFRGGLNHTDLDTAIYAIGHSCF